MKKNVVLFLTSPSSLKRIELSLNNFKQLEKLGYDIITLSTCDFLPDYICDKSKFIIYDYTTHVCENKEYYNYFKKTGFGYFFLLNNNLHRIFSFHKTHFPSLLRNTRSLVHLAKSFDYEKYFYVEDDHFFHDDDLIKIKNYFDELDNKDLIIYSFDRNGREGDIVYCTYFHFGKCVSMNSLIKNFAYNAYDYIHSNPDIYLQFYEYTFKKLITLNKPQDFKILEINKPVSSIFSKSKININYSYLNVDDDVRCNFFYDTFQKKPIFYYHTVGFKNVTNIKIYVDKNLNQNFDLQPDSWYALHIDENLINKTHVILNNCVKKSFEKLNVKDVIYNGELVC